LIWFQINSSAVQEEKMVRTMLEQETKREKTKKEQ
jgi:hypothetical protein